MKAFLPLLLLTGFLPGLALADAVPGPKEDCPSGARGASSHVGPYCQALRCETDSDCLGETSCQPASRCIVERVQKGGWGSGNVYTDMVHPMDDGSCSTGTCEQAHFCIPPGSKEALPDTCHLKSSAPEEASTPAENPTSTTSEPDPTEASDGSTPTVTQTNPPDAPVEENEKGCATVVAGISAGTAGLLGLLALGRRRQP